MKIVCDACQAKYSISDDKVQGKVFKIRCKKCSNIIVVRGGGGAAEAAPAPQEKDTRVYDYGYDGGAGGEAAGGDDAVWHLVINQDQVGPLTVAEVQQRFASGEVDGETFTWREGFADWLPLSQVDTFAALVASGSTTTAGVGGAAAVSSMFGSGDDIGTSRSDPGDLFAAASSPSSRSAGRGDDDDGGDLFGSRKPAAADAASASAQKLRGERNENSVLFSLNNLAQLASDSPRPAPAASSSGSSSGHATGAAGGEGSGLIDIRSMASAYMGGSGGGATLGKPASTSAIGSIDDLPVFGGGGFSEPAVIVPTARAGANNKMLYMMIAAVGLLAVVAIVMVVLLLKGGDKGGGQQVASNDPAQKTDKAADTTENPGEPAAGGAGEGSAAVAAAEPEKKDPEKKEPEKKEPEKAEPEKKESKSSTKTASTKTTTTAKTTTVAKAEPPPKKEAAAESGGCDEVSCVLNNYEGACCAKFRKAKSGAGGGGGGGGGSAPKSDLPESLDRAMISNGIAAVKARVTSCGDKSPAKGKVKVKVQVGADGKVGSVQVETTPDPSLGACVGSAVQKATFSKTQKGGSFSYPFVF